MIDTLWWVCYINSVIHLTRSRGAPLLTCPAYVGWFHDLKFYVDHFDVGNAAHVFFMLIAYGLSNMWGWQAISKDHIINEEIRAREVRLVGAEGEQIGIKPIREALQMAIDLNLDLVNVAPTAKPPVCRIMDYGKYRYEMQKKEKEARKNQKVVELKEVRFSATIDEHDYQTKLRNVVKFLKDEDKVKCSVRFRGREITHASIGQKVLERVAKEVEEISLMERRPKLEGRSMIMILSPK